MVMADKKTLIVTGASQGIGAAVARAFLDRGYNVVGNCAQYEQGGISIASPQLALVDGDIGRQQLRKKSPRLR